MIPEKEREALMRLTMCARKECAMCIYHGNGFPMECYEVATNAMNILAEALRKDESQNCDTCKYKDLNSYEGACDDCTDISGRPSNYEPQTDCAWK